MTSLAPSPDVGARERELGEMILTFNDVTERLKRSHERLGREVRRLREQLDEKNRELARRERLAALGEMAAGVAHEIRNPLAGMRLYASLLRQDLRDRRGELEVVHKIERGIDTLDGLVGDIVLFAGNAPPTPRDVSALELVEEALELAAPRREALRARVDVEGSLSNVGVRCDPGQITRVLLNLLLNALEAAGRGGRVAVRGATRATRAMESGSDSKWELESELELEPESESESVDIVVDDDGPGIAPELADRIFNPFYTTKDTGTGLGLAIAHRIVEAHGGRIMPSRSPWGGARVTLRLARGRVPSRAVEPGRSGGG